MVLSFKMLIPVVILLAAIAGAVVLIVMLSKKKNTTPPPVQQYQPAPSQNSMNAQQRATANRFCPYCGKGIESANHQFCPNCGNKF
ncbi:MAG: hypothetical protein IKB50_01080 [Clostridia bacterium]|nr:hypothetical protein [Clostridia bacterium]